MRGWWWWCCTAALGKVTFWATFYRFRKNLLQVCDFFPSSTFRLKKVEIRFWIDQGFLKLLRIFSVFSAFSIVAVTVNVIRRLSAHFFKLKNFWFDLRYEVETLKVVVEKVDLPPCMFSRDGHAEASHNIIAVLHPPLILDAISKHWYSNHKCPQYLSSLGKFFLI